MHVRRANIYGYKIVNHLLVILSTYNNLYSLWLTADFHVDLDFYVYVYIMVFPVTVYIEPYMYSTF